MAYYKAYSKKTGSSDAYIIAEGFNRKDIFEKSQRTANESGQHVTIIEERKVRGGRDADIYELFPES